MNGFLGQALCSQFGCVKDVVTTADLLKRFQGLSFIVVLRWASSNSLRVRSENDVVYLLTEWVRAQQPPANAMQLGRLADQVRVLHCGPAYLQHILPNLDWFRHVSDFHLLAKASMFTQLRRKNDDGLDAADEGFPPGWTKTPYRKIVLSPTTILWELDVTAGILARLECGDHVTPDTTPVYTNGFWFTVKLELLPLMTDDDDEYGLGLYVKLATEKMAVAWDGNTMTLPFRCSASVGSVELASTQPVLFMQGSGTGWEYATKSAAATAEELLGPHLVDGKLKGRINLSEVDCR